MTAEVPEYSEWLSYSDMRVSYVRTVRLEPIGSICRSVAPTSPLTRAVGIAVDGIEPQ